MKRFTLSTLLLLATTACVDIDARGSGARGIEVVSTGNDGIRAGGQPTLGDPLVYAGQRITPVSGGTPAPNVARVTGPPTAQADAFARSFLNTIQARSFRERRELCGYFIQTPGGQITATPPIPGTFASCEQPIPRAGQGVFASYHTHGAYGREYDNEVPSPTDLLSDFDFGIDGYVSTPGGRVWRVEFDTRDTVQVCGQGCIAVDPGFVPQGESSILQRFTVGDLQRRNG